MIEKYNTIEDLIESVSSERTVSCLVDKCLPGTLSEAFNQSRQWFHNNVNWNKVQVQNNLIHSLFNLWLKNYKMKKKLISKLETALEVVQKGRKVIACMKKTKDELDQYEKLFDKENTKVGRCWFWMPVDYGKNILVILKKPKMYFATNGDLHKDGGPALITNKGRKFWALNGVLVPQWLAETPAGSLPIKPILELSNVQQRAEGFKKMGWAKALKALNARVVASDNYYELLRLTNIKLLGEFGAMESVQLLKMVCPSTGISYALRVPPNIRTIKNALNYINNDVVSFAEEV